MKTCLSFKHLLVVFGSAISIVSTSYGQGLCRTLLLPPPTESQINETIDSLARMKLELDLNRAEGRENSVTKSIRQNYEIKKADLQRALNLSDKEITRLLIQKIAEKQNDKTQDQKEESKVRQQQESVLQDIPHYRKIKSHQSSSLDKGILSPNGQFLHFFGSNPKKIVSLNLETGIQTPTSYESKLEMNDGLILKMGGQWNKLHLDTGATKELNTSMTSGTFAKLRVSVDKKTLIDFSEELQNPADGTLNIDFRDSTALILKHREIPFKLPVTDIPYVSDQYMLIASGERVFKYDIQTENLLELTDIKSGIFTPVEGTNKVVLREDAHKFALIDLDTNGIQRRHFDKFGQTFYAKGDRIMIHERDSSATAHFHIIKTSDFTKSDESLPDRSNFFIQEIPGTDYVTLHNEYINSTEKPGIYHKDDLLVSFFDFDTKFNANGTSQVHQLWVSKDGRRIISTVFKLREMPMVEVWEKEE